MNYPTGADRGISFFHRDGLTPFGDAMRSCFYFLSICLIAATTLPRTASSQIHIAHIQPDAAAPGMTIVLEVMAFASDSGSFGNDGLDVRGTSMEFANPADSNRVIVGPLLTSWNGRLLQIPILLPASAPAGVVPFVIHVGSKITDTINFSIVTPQSAITLSNGAILGSGSATGIPSSGNTFVVDSLVLSGGLRSGLKFQFSRTDSGFGGQGNPRYLPITILSRGPIRIDTAQLTVSADSMLDGGPGGGGGGHGSAGTGGAGFTGGGSDEFDSAFGTSNTGSGGASTDSTGGISLTGVYGGHSDHEDQGGGGGTGCPFGTSGLNGPANDTSRSGGFGGGSAGGENSLTTITYGGGGGGFGTDGTKGSGPGSNQGHTNGGRFIVPLQGGSGGGAGNASNQDTTAGSGGGGGGAIQLVSFDAVTLQDAFLSADGANGKSAITHAAGGGGGSGGAIIVSAKHGFVAQQLSVSTFGGHGGLGGILANPGGDGGIGRVRLDGEIILSPDDPPIHAVTAFGPSLDPIDTLSSTRAITLSGFDEDTTNLTDSVRIYYRNRHTNWQIVNTTRVLLGGHFVWESHQIFTNDSELYVVALAQVRSPGRSPAMFEPDWLMTDISLGIIKHMPSSYIVQSTDTLDFGCIKIDSCTINEFTLRDFGDSAARIDSVIIADKIDFSTVSPSNFVVTPYGSRLDTIQFCPKQPGSYSTLLKIYFGDSTREIVLNGCGLSKDDRDSVVPQSLDLARVHVGSCDTLFVKIYSVGTDTSFARIGQLFAPFELLHAIDSTRIAPGDSLTAGVIFCPTDTGSFSTALVIHSDSIPVSGIGIKSILNVKDSEIFPTICFGDSISITEVLRDVGNDTVTISSISGIDSTIRFNLRFPLKVLPHDSLNLVWTIHPSLPGNYIRVITLHGSDTSASVRFSGETKKLIAHGSALDFGIHCMSGDTLTRLAYCINGSGDSLRVSAEDLGVSNSFTMNGSVVGASIAPFDTLRIPILFHPSTTGRLYDTLQLTLSDGVCDSTIRVPIAGFDTSANAVFTSSLLQFDSTLVGGGCALDTVMLVNPCGLPFSVTASFVSKPFTLMSPANFVVSDSLSDTIIFEFCPLDTGLFGTSVSFVDQTIPADSFTVQLRGRGYRSPVIPTTAQFLISSATGQPGLPLTTTVSLKSLTGLSALDSFSAVLQYDPSVVMPLSIAATPPNSYLISGIESPPGHYSLQVSGGNIQIGPVATVLWLPLVGPRDSTLDTLLPTIPLPSASAIGDIGVIRIAGCGNLAGNIRTAGAYALSPPNPNPTSSSLNLDLTLGAEGPVTLAIFNAVGAEEIRVFDGDVLSAGVHHLQIDLSKLTSGLYFVQTLSLGWKAIRSVLLTK